MGKKILKKDLFISFPAYIPTGPVKGAFAIAEALKDDFEVTLISIKKSAYQEQKKDMKHNFICLEDVSKSFYGRVRYLKMLANTKQSDQLRSLSLCFSADLINFFALREYKIISSVRGNIVSNYRFDYGVIGLLLALVHFFLLRFFDLVLVMNKAMKLQLLKNSNVSATIIENFIDEDSFKRFLPTKKKCISNHFVFVGTLSNRKNPLLFLRAVSELNNRGVKLSADILGDGPLRAQLESQIKELKLEKIIKVSGFVEDIEMELSKASVMVLPSYSEGIARAAMEALYLGIPCVMRNVDDNKALIEERKNGALFESDIELPDAMLRANKIFSENKMRIPLLPKEFRKDVCRTKLKNAI